MLAVVGARREIHEDSEADATPVRVENQFADESRQVSSAVYIENFTRQERQDRSLFATSLESGSDARLVVGNIPGVLANQIKTTNHTKAETAFQISASPLVLFGIKGSGKTQLAATIARECVTQQFRFTGWIDGAERGLVLSRMAVAAERLSLIGDDEEVEQGASALRDYLNSTTEPTLLVVDGVSSIDAVRDLLPVAGRCKVIITTNDSTLADIGNGIRIEALDRAESLILLGSQTSDGREICNKIAERLGDLVLALAQASALTRRRGWTPRQYLERLESVAISEMLPPGAAYPKGAAEAILVSLEEAFARSTSVNPGDTALVVALLDPSGVTSDLLFKLLPPGVSRDAMDEHLGELVRYCLASPLLGGGVTMHELVSRVLVDRAEKDGSLAHHLSRVALALEEDLGDVHTTWPSREATQQASAHCLALWQKAILRHSPDNGGRPPKQLLHLMDVLISKSFESGDPSFAESLARIYEEDARSVFGQVSVEAAQASNLLGCALTSRGDVDASLAKHEEALTVRLSLLGPDHVDSIGSRRNVAKANLAKGRIEEARASLAEVYESRVRLYGARDSRTLASLDDLAGALLSEGRTNDAVARYEQVVRESSESLGPQHPHTLISSWNLSNAYSMSGDITRGMRNKEDILPVSREVFGRDHTNVITLQVTLARDYFKLDRAADALNLLQESLDGSVRQSGVDSPTTIAVFNELAQPLLTAGEGERLVKIYEDLLKADSEVFNRNIASAAGGLNCVGLAYSDSENYEQARQLHEKILQYVQTHQADEISISTIEANLALALDGLGRSDDAQRMITSAATRQRRALPVGSEKVWVTHMSLIQYYEKTGLFEEAEKELAALESAWSSLENKPVLLVIRTYRAQLLRKAGDSEDAAKAFSDLSDAFAEFSGQGELNSIAAKVVQAQIIYALGDHAKAVSLYEDALERSRTARGPDAPDSIRIEAQLVGCLMTLGDAQALLPQLRDVLRRATTVLGSEDDLVQQLKEQIQQYFPNESESAEG
jgi:tetratricopeptide (TPR) repeat protein